MSPKHLVFAVVLLGLWVADISAQVQSPTASQPTSAVSDKPGASSTGSNSPNKPTDPNAVGATSDMSAEFPLQGTPSTGSDATSPPSVPGSPPTAAR